MTYANGDVYEGNWKNGNRTIGVIRKADGRIYDFYNNVQTLRLQ